MKSDVDSTFLAALPYGVLTPPPGRQSIIDAVNFVSLTSHAWYIPHTILAMLASFFFSCCALLVSHKVNTLMSMSMVSMYVHNFT